MKKLNRIFVQNHFDEAKYCKNYHSKNGVNVISCYFITYKCNSKRKPRKDFGRIFPMLITKTLYHFLKKSLIAIYKTPHPSAEIAVKSVMSININIINHILPNQQKLTFQDIFPIDLNIHLQHIF